MCDRATRHYVAAKLRLDPVYADVLALAAGEPFGVVADLGCGRGHLGVALLAAGCADRVLACDRDEAAIAQARRAAEGLAYVANPQDLACDRRVPDCDSVLLIDVLYVLGRDAALALLKAAAKAARQRVLVRTIDPGQGRRSRLAMRLERLALALRPLRGRRFEPPPPATLAAVLAAHGYVVEARPCSRGTPFSNLLLVARRKPAAVMNQAF